MLFTDEKQILSKKINEKVFRKIFKQEMFNLIGFLI